MKNIPEDDLSEDEYKAMRYADEIEDGEIDSKNMDDVPEDDLFEDEYKAMRYADEMDD